MNKTAQINGSQRVAFYALISLSALPLLAQQPAHPFVIAHYMHTYILGAQKPDVRTQNPERLNHLDRDSPKEFESIYFPAKEAAQAASGVSANQIDFQEAEYAGVDAFGMLLGPKMLPSSAYSAALNLAAATAQHQKVKIVPEAWADWWDGEDYKLFGQHVKQLMDAHPGAFQMRNGKPVFVLEFNNLSSHLSPADQGTLLAKIQDFLSPWGGLAGTYTIAYAPWDVKQSLEIQALAKANAVDIWTPQDDWSALHSHIAVDVAQALHKELAWPVSPSFYQRRAGGNPMEYGNGLGAAKYIDAWLQALTLHPSFIDIQTWNDFSEGTAIRPTNATGDTLLDLTKYLHEWVERGSEPPITKEQVMLFHPKQLVNATLDDAGAKVLNAAWRHKTPTVDYIDCVVFLKEPANVSISLGGSHWEQTMPAGFHEFLVIAHQQSPPARKGEVVEGPDSFPSTTSMRFVTMVSSPFSAATPEVTIKRNGTSVLNLKSRYTFLGHAQFQDLTLVGDEADIK